MAVITLEMLAMRNRSPGSIGSAGSASTVVDVDVDESGGSVVAAGSTASGTAGGGTR